jgi:riboflavin synthase alpha subunit
MALSLHATMLMRVQSSLTMSLLRLIVTEGEMVYDGISTTGLNLEAVRSGITIIPQVVSSICPYFIS